MPLDEQEKERLKNILEDVAHGNEIDLCDMDFVKEIIPRIFN